MKLGEYVKNYRAQERMSVRSFAAISGLSAGYISMLENNRNPKTGEPITPSIDTYKAVAKATGINVGDLVASVSDDIDISGSRDNIQIPSGAIPFQCNYMAPVLGRIPAGYPVLANDEIIGYYPINVPNPDECFWLVVNGDSMVDAGIELGDQVLIRKQPTADNGQIVACMVNGEEATLKRFHQQGETVILYPANAKYQPIVIPMSDFESGKASIIGVVLELRRGF